MIKKQANFTMTLYLAPHHPLLHKTTIIITLSLIKFKILNLGGNMSYTVVLLPILAALTTAENAFLGQNTKWLASNNTQKVFIDQYMTKKDQYLKLLVPDEMKVKASRKISEINEFLKANNFDIQLNDSNNGRPADFATAAIFNIAVQWAKTGKITEINTNNAKYPAVKINKDFNVFSCSAHSQPIVAVSTKTSDTVYITIADKPRSGFELLDYVAKIKNDTENYNAINIGRVIFPMVDLNQKVDISWLVGMKGAGSLDTARIAEALQQTKFQMDEKGAAAQSAVAISFERCFKPQQNTILTIDKPFFVWIEREGLDIPLFAGYIDYVDWKKPQSTL